MYVKTKIKSADDHPYSGVIKRNAGSEHLNS